MTDHIVDANKKVAPRCGDCRWWLGNSSGVGLCLAKAADPLWNFVGGGPVVSSSDECKCEGKLFTPKDPAHDQR